ncbi:MAG: nucleotidyltransferase domain-containing protein [bacterium]|nr:nucleotidyltransferase domain-containing protein [bacterium]
MRDSLVETLGEALTERPEVELALLFGSRARGTQREDSDVDVAVEGDRVDPFELAAHLSLKSGHEVDVVDLRRAGYPLLKAILREGIVVYQGRKGGEGRWRSQAIARVELDRRWFERMRDGFLRKMAEGFHG